jgi:hypothetical protein
MEEGDGTGNSIDEAWVIWEPLIEAVRPRGKTSPHDLRHTIWHKAAAGDDHDPSPYRNCQYIIHSLCIMTAVKGRAGNGIG